MDTDPEARRSSAPRILGVDPYLVPCLIVHSQPGLMTPFNLVPVPIARAAMKLLWLASTPFHILRYFGAGRRPEDALPLHLQFHVDGETFAAYFPLRWRSVVVWTDSMTLVEEIQKYQPLLTLVITESAEAAQQCQILAAQLPLANMAVVEALDGQGAYTSDLPARIWLEFVQTIHRLVPELWPMVYPPERSTFTFADLETDLQRGVFLPPFAKVPAPAVSDDLLVRINQVILNSLRGHLPVLDPTQRPDDPPAEASRLAFEILATRELLTVCETVRAATIPKDKLATRVPRETLDRIEQAIDPNAPLAERLTRWATLLTDMPVSAMVDLSAQQIIVTCPSVSVVPGEGFRTRAAPGHEVRFTRLPQYLEGYGKTILDALAIGGRRIVVPQPETPEQEELLQATVATVRMETQYLSAIGLFYANRFGAPVIKTESMGNDLMRSLKDLADRFASFEWGDDAPGGMTFESIRSGLTAVSSKIAACFPQAYIDLFDRLNRAIVHAFTDVPLELLRVGDDYLGYRSDLSRTPVTPGVISYRNYIATEAPAFLPLTSKEIVVVSPLLDTDDAFEGLWSTLRTRFWKVALRKVSTKSELLKAFETRDVLAIIYLGHGHYDPASDETGLELSDGWIGTSDIEDLARVPPLVALLGCSTAAAGATLGPMHVPILERGARLVIGTSFPVDKRVGAAFLLNLLAELGRTQARDLAEIVRRARLATRPFSDLVCLERRGVITTEQVKELADEYEHRLFQHQIPRDARAAMLQVELDLLAARGAIVERSVEALDAAILPYPLFFSVFGFPWTTYGALFSGASS